MRHCIAAAEARAAAKAARAQQAATSQPTGDEETERRRPTFRALRSAPWSATGGGAVQSMPPGATIEDRVRMALKSIRVRGTLVAPAPAAFAMSPQSVSAG